MTLSIDDITSSNILDASHSRRRAFNSIAGWNGESYTKPIKYYIHDNTGPVNFEILNNDKKSLAEFIVISRTPHTLLIEAKFKNNDLALVNFLLRINIYIDAKLAEAISYQQEKPVPFFSPPQFSQSLDEKYQQNRILTEWLENIFTNGAVEVKEINFLNG